MKKVDVTIEGIEPGLLQHRFPMEENTETKSVKRKVEYPSLEEAQKCLYTDEDGIIYQPAEHILGCLVKAGANFSYERRRTYKDVMKSCVFISPTAIPHQHTEWSVDRRPVVIMKARIVRSRPLFKKWALSFSIEYDEEVLNVSKLKELLEFAGTRIGIGDYRPLFGRFIVTRFESQ